MPETLLVLTGVGVPPYSGRGIKETLTPIDATRVTRRNVNGSLRDVSPAQMRKYRLALSCADQNPPALGGLWPGDVILTVETISELAYLTGGTPERTAVSGSERTDGAFTFYRPVLEMMVISFSAETDEWPHTLGWQMELEEV
jgi:hypothetical protein